MGERAELATNPHTAEGKVAPIQGLTTSAGLESGPNRRGFAAGAAGLPLSMLHLAERLLTALADRPQPGLMVHGAEMLRHARRIASGLTSGDQMPLPDLELIRELLSECRPFRPLG